MSTPPDPPTATPPPGAAPTDPHPAARSSAPPPSVPPPSAPAPAPAPGPTRAGPAEPPSTIGAVAVRPTATLRTAAAPTRAEMAGRPTLLTVRPWDDALLDQFGHDPRSPYVERFWLGVIGPSATWMLRAFAHRFDAEPEGFTVDLRDTARSLGIGARGGANGALYRTLERIIAFGFARFSDDATLDVRRRMGPLNRRQLQRLIPELQVAHDEWLAANPTTASSVDDMRRRARALALSLLELGEDLEATEHQLHRWRFHPAVAYDAVRWAASVHEHRRAHGGANPSSDHHLAGGGDAA